MCHYEIWQRHCTKVPELLSKLLFDEHEMCSSLYSHCARVCAASIRGFATAFAHLLAVSEWSELNNRHRRGLRFS